jgi:HrpA-like RNA helicase
MQQYCANLPIHAHKEEIVQTVQDHKVTIISGATGSGKSTGAPQAILDANPCCSIVVTQPRRISAISIAERVAQEQCLEPVGGLIGYQVRLESAVSTRTQLLFLTPGVLLRKLQSSPLLAEFTHVVIDEIHERDKYTEFLLIVLRDLIPKRPDLRVVLMSATLQTNKLFRLLFHRRARHSRPCKSEGADISSAVPFFWKMSC